LFEAKGKRCELSWESPGGKIERNETEDCNDGKHEAYYLSEDNNPIIISREPYQAVQSEKQHRGNVTMGEGGNQRKSKKYCSKKRIA